MQTSDRINLDKILNPASGTSVSHGLDLKTEYKQQLNGESRNNTEAHVTTKKQKVLSFTEVHLNSH